MMIFNFLAQEASFFECILSAFFDSRYLLA